MVTVEASAEDAWRISNRCGRWAHVFWASLRICLWVLILSEVLRHEAGAQEPAAAAPAPLLQADRGVDWWFVFKFNAKSFPGCGGAVHASCPFGGTPVNEKLSQQFVFASSDDHVLKKGAGCVGDTATDPVGATFGALYNGPYFYVVWNDQFYQDPAIVGCGNACSLPWGHSKGILAWNAAGEGVVMQVTTPSWPGAGNEAAKRQSDGNTLGCVSSTDNVLVSQHFFALRLRGPDVLNVLKALANASVVTDPTNPQLVRNGGPSEVQEQVNKLGKRSASAKPIRVQLSSGVGLLSKPSALHVPPWQLVSAMLGRAPLRVASWWTNPAIESTTLTTRVDCWDDTLPRPGAVQIATSGSWDGTEFGLKGGPGPDFNHAKIGVSTGSDHHFVIFGDMNQQGALSDENCGRSQNGRGGLFFIVDDEPLAKSVGDLIQGDSAPVRRGR